MARTTTRRTVHRVPRRRGAHVPRPSPPGDAIPRSRVLNRGRAIGVVVLTGKFLAFCAWSALLYRRFALTPDFAQYQQAW